MHMTSTQNTQCCGPSAWRGSGRVSGVVRDQVPACFRELVVDVAVDLRRWAVDELAPVVPCEQAVQRAVELVAGLDPQEVFDALDDAVADHRGAGAEGD